MKTNTNITTKHDELRFRTADMAQMLNRYLAENVIAEYPGDFVGDDGNITTIKRSQKLFDLGTYIDQETAAKIMFYIQSGEIKDVVVSNQKRLGFDEWTALIDTPVSRIATPAATKIRAGASRPSVIMQSAER